MRRKIVTFYLFFGLVFLTVCGRPEFASAAFGRKAESPVIAPKTIEDAGNPAMRIFTDEDGLPVNSVMALERDPRGFLWIGTQDGAAFYNGHEITAYDLPNKSVFNYIYDILAASDGSMWFASSGGLHRFQNGRWQSFSEKDGLLSDATRCLLETFSDDGRPILWVGTRDGLAKFEGGVWTNFDEKSVLLPDRRVRSLLETRGPDGAKTLWVGTYGGLMRLESGKDRPEIFTAENGLPNDVIFSLIETRDEKGESIVWIGTDGGLAKFEKGRLTSENLPRRPVRSLLQTKTANGLETLWVGTGDGGLYFEENGRWRNLTRKNGLPNDLIFSLAATGAPDGSVWAATLGGGAARIERSNWTKFTDENGLPNKTVFAIAENAPDDFWFGTYGGGAVRFADGSWSVSDESAGLLNDFVHCLMTTENEAGEKVLYAGTERGATKYENGKWTEIKIEKDKSLGEVWKIYETEPTDAGGEKIIWFATNSGLVKAGRGETTVFNAKNGLPDDRVRAVLETGSGGAKTLWVGTYSGGLVRLQNGEWTVFNQQSGLPSNRVYDIAEVETGDSKQIWVGTAGGAAYFDPGEEKINFQVLTTGTEPALPNDFVYRILQDAKGRIYLPTNKGVARISPNASGGFDLYTFTTADGLPSNETVAGAGLVDSRGNIWVGTVSGAAMLDLSKETEDDRPKPLYLEKIFVGGKELDLAPHTGLAYDQNHLVFEYVLMNPFRESATRYRTQLVGLESEPTAWTPEPRREYTFLPDGEFTFKVWGMDAAGNVSRPVEVPFEIYPAWWRTWWAFSLYLLLTAGVVALFAYVIYRYRLQRIIEIERVRTRIATDLHDDIGASLSQISILSEVLAHKQNGNLDNREALKMIAETSRDLTGAMSDVIWSINPNRDRLRDLIQRMRRFASDVLSPRDIDFQFLTAEFETNEKLDVDIRQQIYLVFKEAVNNAVKHSGCTRLRAELRSDNDRYVLLVTDDGKGFRPNESGEGNGLFNMKNRARAAGGRLELETEEGKGTRIVLTIPHKKSVFARPAGKRLGGASNGK
jgi:ligand-binding sensor domain-containing protein/two-component sensor histidine kinase